MRRPGDRVGSSSLIRTVAKTVICVTPYAGARNSPWSQPAVSRDFIIHPLATTGIIIIFVIFILLQREDLRNRLIRLAGSYDLQRTTAALDDAAGRLSRLFLTQLILNSGFGVVIGIGLWLIGTPSAILWGILATVLRFVPYIGAVIAAAFPLALLRRQRFGPHFGVPLGSSSLRL